MIDTSNIKKKPAKFYYYYKCINRRKYDERQITTDLNNFIGSSGNYMDLLFFNIDDYMNKGKNLKYSYFDR